MDLLYSSTAGAIDLAALVATALVAWAFGGAVPRGLALVLVAGFLIDRAQLLFVPADLFPLMAGVSALALCWALIGSTLRRSRVALAFAALLFLKSMACWAMVLGLSFANAATAVTVLAYLQMLLTWGGAGHGLAGHLRRGGSDLGRNGNSRGRGAVAGGLPSVSSPDVLHAGGTTAAHRPAPHRQTVTPRDMTA